MRTNYLGEWERFFHDDVPAYVQDAGKSYLTIRAAVWEGAPPQVVRITPDDVACYYAREAGSMSGVRTLAGFSSDWRTVDGMAQLALGWFKRVNVVGLRRAARGWGLALLVRAGDA